MKRKCLIKEEIMSGTGSRTNNARPSSIICRFVVKYRYFIVPIGVFLVVQLLLALCLGFLCPDDLGPIWTVSSESNNNGNQIQASRAIVTTSPILDWNSLSFTPRCNITSKDAISAINRAKTHSCKEQLAETACKIVENSLYPKTLVRNCFNNFTKYQKPFGCFKDDKNHRILPDNYVLQKENNSPQSCVNLCLQSGFQYAGVQYGVECFCGNSEPSSELKLSATECNMKCPNLLSQGNESFCGGYFAMDVFETGIFINKEEEKNIVIGLEDYSSDERSLNDKKSARVVFFLTLNGRALRQVLRMIKALFHERHFFYIHVDSRQDYLYRELLSLSYKLPNNVRFITNRRATIWGGASLLTILLSGMEDLSLHSKEWGWEWDYFINLSESDFPLKSTKHLEYFLSQNIGKNFLKSHGRDMQKFIQKQGLDKTFDECEYRMWRVGDRKLPLGIVVDGGSDWIALHRDFVEYLTKSGDELVTGLKTVFKHTLLPAESFFHTLLRNSEMCGTFVDNNLHVTNWRRKLGCKCQYRNIVDWCGCSPNDFRLTDWNRLQMTESRLLFFGRKFEAIVNQGIINQLETWLYPSRFETNYPTMDKFWLSLFHHHDLSPKPDDSLITLGRSLSRIASRIFISKYFPSIDTGSLNNSSYNVELLEITAYNNDDTLEGILIKFHTSLLENEIKMEVWFKSETFIELGSTNSRTSKYQHILKDLKVGADYEQKEQIFRNFASAIGSFSEPTLAFNVYAKEPFNLSIAWIDPRNVIQSLINVTTSDGITAYFAKPVLKSPLTPGNWSAKVMTIHHDLIYRLKFLVFPLEIYQWKSMSGSEERLVNSVNAEDESLFSSQRLQQKIDELVSKHFEVQDFCLVSHLTSSESLETSLCSHTQWSSFYPDPKSTIQGIDAMTGLLLP